MRFIRIGSFNWKYIIGEVLLIFVGISLAIWFNNWNASSKNERAKGIAIVKIKEEVKNNIDELALALKSNEKILKAYREYTPLFGNTPSTVRATYGQFDMLSQKYPGFFNVTDSTILRNDVVEYHGSLYVLLEIPTLTNIAWETTKSISITNEFTYECLFELEGAYSLQARVQHEFDKASDALQKRDINQMISILEFLDQLGRQLDEKYKSLMERIDDCA